jgi:hypothetical protein
MLITELYNGQGLGNQLWCYVTTRVIAADHGYRFGIKSPEKFKGSSFLDVDFGEPVLGGRGPEGGPPVTLPKGIVNYYAERRIGHPLNGVDIRTFDPNLTRVPDCTKIDGVLQDEQYIAHRKDEVREWLRFKPDEDCCEFASEDWCVINFRGGEYVHIPNVFLPQSYWDQAIARMRRLNPDFRFVVVTDDAETAKCFFPDFQVHHFGMGRDYAIVKNARYLILSNSSFACLPAWLNRDLKTCIAPKYWSQYNRSDGYWGCSYNMMSGWQYLDREGELFTYDECKAEFGRYMAAHPAYFPDPPSSVDYSFKGAGLLRRLVSGRR